RLWRAAGWGRGIWRWQVTAFAAGLLVVLLALQSPLDALAEALFSAHMTQHLLLVLVAPPLLIWGNPVVAGLWALPRARRARVLGWWRASRLRHEWDAISHPAAAWTLHAATLVAWHIPPMFNAALRSDPVHALEHASFLGTALLFWWPVLHPAGRRRLGYGGALLYVFGMFMLGGGLGALLTFASTVLYAQRAPTSWGLSRLQDQQLAGLIMWIPAGAVYVLAAGGLVLQWFRADARRDRLPGAQPPPFAPELLPPTR
ncbi:MAG TPA: cytochrome c oxidase assembly protein, partial [Longimicrobiales bacterium]